MGPFDRNPMKDKRCFICKYEGKINLETQPNQLFGDKKFSQIISLCYSHSVELFKNGQVNFTVKYKANFTEYAERENEDARVISFF